LRQSASAHIVTTVAAQTLARAMVHVTETHTVRASRSRSR
jgi:hypothetical protein